jgi:hypothetical protein
MMENDEITPVAMENDEITPVAAAAANKKQKAAEDKARRDAHLQRLIDNTTWQDADNFIVEDNILKQIIGFDPAVFPVDMLRKICGKLGFVSRKYTKNVCLETIVKAFHDLRAYDRLEPTSSSNMDSTSVRCRLLNVIMSDALVTRFQMLGARKDMAELDRGGAGQDKTFWEDAALEFNDYSPEKASYGLLVVTSAYDKKVFSEKNVDPSVKLGADKSWEALRSIYLLVQKDYKKKFERFKTSGNHESNFHDFCHGRLDTYYLHFWLQLRDSNLLETIVEDLPEDVGFESNNNGDESTISTKGASSKKKRKTPADVLEKHLKEKREKRNNNEDVLKVQKAVRVQLKSYCMGMKELISLKKYKNSSEDDEDERQLIERMKATVGAAVSQMESHIQAGTIWCPTSEPTSERDAKAQSTPKQHNIMKRMSSTSSVSSTVRNILPDSNEKDIVPRSSTSSVDSNQESFCYDT